MITVPRDLLIGQAAIAVLVIAFYAGLAGGFLGLWTFVRLAVPGTTTARSKVVTSNRTTRTYLAASYPGYSESASADDADALTEQGADDSPLPRTTADPAGFSITTNDWACKWPNCSTWAPLTARPRHEVVAERAEHERTCELRPAARHLVQRN